MADDVRRPPGGNVPTPNVSASRARNRTMVMGANSMDRMRSQVESEDAGAESWSQDSEPTSGGAPQVSSPYDSQDPLGLESSGYNDAVSEEKTLQALDEIFDLGPAEPVSAPPPAAPHRENEFDSYEDATDPADPELRALTEIIQPAPISVARIVRPAAPPPVQAPPVVAAPAATTVSVPKVTQAPSVVTKVETKPPGGIAVSDKHEEIFWRVEGPLVGFLVSFDHDPRGTYVELRTGRLIVSSQQEESGNCLVIRDVSVSPMHAIMRVAPGGIVQVLDQLSESGTRVKHIGQQEEVFLSGEKATVAHGDVVFFGDRKFHVLLVLGDGE